MATVSHMPGHQYEGARVPRVSFHQCSIGAKGGGDGLQIKLNTSAIREAIGDRVVFRRGRTLCQKRKVFDVREDSGTQFTGSVRDRADIHDVDIEIYPTAAGSFMMSGYCTCSRGFNCEHAAAVLLHIAAARHSDPVAQSVDEGAVNAGTPASRELPDNIQVWLNTFDPDEGDAARAEISRPSRVSCDALFYVFQRTRDGKAEIRPFKAYVKKDGQIGKNVKEHHVHGLSTATSAMNHDDVVICAQIAYFTGYSHLRPRGWPQGAPLEQFLQQIVVTGRARYGDVYGQPLQWAADIEVRFDWAMGEDGTQSLEAWDRDGQKLILLPFPDPVAIDPRRGHIGFVNSGLPANTARFMARAPVVPPTSVEQLAGRLANRFGSAVPTPAPVNLVEKADLKPMMTLILAGHRVMSWENDLELYTHPYIRAHIRYAGHKSLLVPGSGKDIRSVRRQTVSIIRRDLGAERQLLEMLYDVVEPYHGDPVQELQGGAYWSDEIRGAHVIFPPVQRDNIDSMQHLIEFMTMEVPHLKESGWSIETEAGWPVNITEAEIDYRTEFIAREGDWFSLALKIEVDEMELDLVPTIRQLAATLPLDGRGKLKKDFDLGRHLESVTFYQLHPQGQLVPVPGSAMRGFVEAFLEIQATTEFHRADAAQVWKVARALDGCGAKWVGGQAILDLGQRLDALTRVQGDIQPPSLTADLRPYQKQGYGWLKALSDSGFGGILADDMGLGKTLQALALLTHHHIEQKAGHPSLLVVPTSLVSNWQNEAARFAPHLKILNLHGRNRHERFQSIPSHHLVLTTYPLIHRDQDALFAHEYELAILDEAQAVKNPAARTAKLIRNIDARQRIALTGTPLENNLLELWALFDWLIPGFLGDRKRFGKEFRRPIEKLGDGATQERLSNRIRPFLLRRTKDDVLEELPPKTIIDETVSLGSGQAQLYESVRAAMDKRVREAVEERGLARSRITVLDALLKLRQVCCDPQLVKLKTATKVKESAKRARLNDIIEQLMSENRKVLVFSQFVEMLRLIESDVQKHDWKYAMLHGSTRNREVEIEKFQSGHAPLFLISLKAGGIGLNLTAADTVILYDPWWNPAVERQAMDRAHRIGQDKPVFVYRLFCEDTVETAIQAMQEKKQALADALFKGGASSTLSLTEEDLAQLFGSG